MSTASLDVAIVGAGPYGLALAAHLAERGVEHRIFGPSTEAWRSMSAGMHLKSSAASFGPLFRFVAGAQYTVAHVARHLTPTRLGAARFASNPEYRRVR
jgi:2-polyprenyl-6-methoxyphenol hydroxylase-like FAD-dependent oxidoreductase